MKWLDRLVNRLASTNPEPPPATGEAEIITEETMQQLAQARARRPVVERSARAWARERQENHFSERIAQAYRAGRA